MNNVFSSNQKTKQTTGNDHSVSLVQMQASLDFDDLKAFKKNSNVGSGQPIIEESSPNEETGNFDVSRDSARFKPNESRCHYMEEENNMSPSRSENGRREVTNNEEENNNMLRRSARGSIAKNTNRKSNRRSGKVLPPENEQNCCR